MFTPLAIEVSGLAAIAIAGHKRYLKQYLYTKISQSMKTKLTLFILALLCSMGIWAQNYIVPSATKVNSITSGGYYVIDGLAQDNTTGHYLYDNGTKVTSGTLPTDATAEKFMWKIVGNTSDGYTLQNKFTGNYMNLGSSDGSTISTSSTSQANVIYFTGEKYATVCNATTNQAIDVGSKGTNPTTWTGSTTKAEGSRRLMIYDVSISLNKIYTIKAYFSDYTDLYFYNNDGALGFNSTASHGVKDYWIARPSDNSTYPWRFESGRGDGKYLSPANGLSTSGGWVQVPYCSNVTTETCVHLYGSYDDASTSNIRYLATWSPEGTSKKSGFAKTGSGGCFGGEHNNSEWSTDFVIAEVTGVDIYTVVSNIADGGVTYSPSYTGQASQENGGFYIFSSAPSASDFTAISISNYTPGAVTVDASAKTITVNYTANITYTLTDANGATYSWSANGSFGTAPTLTGCYGYTLSNEAWNEGSRTYTADITFPFSVSSNDVTNYHYIGCHKYYGYQNIMRLYAKTSSSTVVQVQKNVLPTNQDGENERYKWSIIPAFSSGAFTFTIKNESTGKYITSTSNQDGHTGNEVSLSASGTPLTYIHDGYGESWYVPSISKYLSVNSYNTNEEQYLGTWGNTHSGTSVAIIEPVDFTTLTSNLTTAYTTFNAFFTAYSPYLSNGTYAETVANTMATTYGNNGEVQQVLGLRNPTIYKTAAQLQAYIDAYNAAMDGVYYVMPSGKFIRFKNVDGSKYAKTPSAINYSDYYQLVFSADGTDAASIFYLTASNNLLSYYYGSYLFAINYTCPVEWASYKDEYEFLKGSTANRIYVHAANVPSGWGGNDKYWSGGDSNVDRVATPTSDCDFLIEEVTSLPITMNLSDGAYYATINLPVAVEIPSGLSAYSATAAGDVLTLTKVVEDGVLAANTPVILYSESSVTSLDIASTAGTAAVSNELEGTTAAISVTANQNYVLNCVGGQVGFYLFNGTAMPGFKAYLPSSATSNVKAFIFSFEDAEDAIRAIESENSGLEIYDISGRRVQKAQKGLYIVNGKKVMYK